MHLAVRPDEGRPGAHHERRHVEERQHRFARAPAARGTRRVGNRASPRVFDWRRCRCGTFARRDGSDPSRRRAPLSKGLAGFERAGQTSSFQAENRLVSYEPAIFPRYFAATSVSEVLSTKKTPRVTSARRGRARHSRGAGARETPRRRASARRSSRGAARAPPPGTPPTGLADTSGASREIAHRFASQPSGSKQHTCPSPPTDAETRRRSRRARASPPPTRRTTASRPSP